MISFAPKAFSQLDNIYQPKSWEYKKDKTAHPRLTYKSNRKSFVNDTTKVREDKSVVRLKLRAEYQGNNGKGADIYAMQPYNMPCLKPDSTFQSRMPVAQSRIIMREPKN